MFPRLVNCQDCGQIASVRGYGRIEYAWPETTTPGRETTIPTINCIRLTIDCPCCGVMSQDYFPNEDSPSARHFKPSTIKIDATGRPREVRFQRLGPMNRPRV